MDGGISLSFRGGVLVVQASLALQKEGGAPLSRFEAADNIDLGSIIREFEAFYEVSGSVCFTRLGIVTYLRSPPVLNLLPSFLYKLRTMHTLCHFFPPSSCGATDETREEAKADEAQRQ